jgi:small subunit ribosomal protein S6
MAGPYDLMLMLDPTAPEERRTAAISEAESIIGSGGELLATHDWGQRRMAYEIDHRPEAEYRLYQFDGDNALLDRLNQRLRILDGVLRFRIIKFKPGQPTPPPPDQQAPRRREEREAQDTKVAARAAADAPPHEEEGAAAPATADPAAAPPATPPVAEPPSAEPAAADPAAPPADPAAPAPADAEPADAAPADGEPASPAADE